MLKLTILSLKICGFFLWNTVYYNDAFIEYTAGPFHPSVQHTVFMEITIVYPVDADHKHGQPETFPPGHEFLQTWRTKAKYTFS